MFEIKARVIEWLMVNALDPDDMPGSGKVVGEHDDILDFLDSVVLLELLSFCELTFDIEFSPQEIIPESFNSVASIHQLVQNKLNSKLSA